MNYYFYLFDRSDCFLCKFYKWVESFFVYNDSPSKLVSYGPRTSPFEHFTTYHPEIAIVLVTLIFVAIFFFCVWTSKSTSARELASESSDYSDDTESVTKSTNNASVQITLYGFKTVEHELGKEYYPELPTREGYAFTGWFYDPSFTKTFMPGKKLKKNITLYPRWQKE